MCVPSSQLLKNKGNHIIWGRMCIPWTGRWQCEQLQYLECNRQVGECGENIDNRVKARWLAVKVDCNDGESDGGD